MGSQASTLRPEVIEDLAEETAFTESEIRQWYKKFLEETDHPRLSMDVKQFREIYAEVGIRNIMLKLLLHTAEIGK